MPTCTSFSLSENPGRCSRFPSLDRIGQFCAILPRFSGENQQSVSKQSFPLCLILLGFFNLAEIFSCHFMIILNVVQFISENIKLRVS